MAKKIDELPLKIGKAWEVRVRGAEYEMVVRGWKPGQYIIVDRVLGRGENLQAGPDSGCSAKYYHEGQFVTLRTRVIQALYHESAILILQYPVEFNRFQLRKTPRFKANFPIKYCCDISGSNTIREGVIRDISSSGIQFLHPQPLSEGDIITFDAFLIGGTLRGQKAIVRNLRMVAGPAPQQFESGAEFLQVPPFNSRLIGNFIRNRTLDRRLRFGMEVT